MTGHEPILAMRRSGLAPRFVWVSDIPSAYLQDGLTVRLSPHDAPEVLDLRFLVGLTALVASTSPSRADRIAAACAKTAKRVISSTFDGRDVTRVTDTDGVMGDKP